MAKSMTHSAITRQITKSLSLLKTALRKSGLPSKLTQQVFESQGSALAVEFVTSVRKRVDVIGSIIIRRVRVDRTRTPQQAIDATGRRSKYLHADAVATMPIGDGDEVDVYFIPTKRFVPVSEVPAFLAQYGLVPDPRAQAAVNEADPAFADKHPNGTQWGDDCGLTFCLDDERHVGCIRDVSGWGDNWFLSGVPAFRK